MSKTPIPDVAFAGAEFHSLRGRSVIITGGASGIGVDVDVNWNVKSTIAADGRALVRCAVPNAKTQESASTRDGPRVRTAPPAQGWVLLSRCFGRSARLGRRSFLAAVCGACRRL